MHHISRREFAAMVAAGTMAGRARPFALRQGAATGPVTAADIVDRIRANVGVAWKADTVDTLKAGDPATRVTGVVTTALASMAVLQQAVQAGANFVVSCEPTFFSRADSPSPPAGRGRGRGAAGSPAGTGAGARQGAPSPPPPDPVFAAKNAFIARHQLVILRLSDHWRLRAPDPFAAGFARLLGWTDHQSAADPRRFDLPASSVVALDTFASTLGTALRSRGGLRIVGNRSARVRRVGLLPGSTPIQASLAMLPEVDAIVAGEVREWESVEYARDVAYSGQGKGLILVGRVVSEEPGMAECAAWLGTLVPEVTVRHVAAGDPYWRPA